MFAVAFHIHIITYSYDMYIYMYICQLVIGISELPLNVMI